MRTLIVTAHPDTESLTHHAAERLQELLGAGEAVIAHLGQEDFDPRFTGGDRDNYLSRGQPDAAVAAEQERIDDATHLVLDFPVYWWSMPGLLKGRIDRVFVAGWAFDSDEEDRIVPGPRRLTMHLLPISGTAAESFARHGYAQSFRTQIEHGIIDFCGIRRGATAFVHESESGNREAIAGAVEAATATIASAISSGTHAAAPAGQHELQLRHQADRRSLCGLVMMSEFCCVVGAGMVMR